MRIVILLVDVFLSFDFVFCMSILEVELFVNRVLVGRFILVYFN